MSMRHFCSSCGDLCQSNDIQISNLWYHERCLKCSYCLKSLNVSNAQLNIDGKPICANCNTPKIAVIDDYYQPQSQQLNMKQQDDFMQQNRQARANRSNATTINSLRPNSQPNDPALSNPNSPNIPKANPPYSPPPPTLKKMPSSDFITNQSKNPLNPPSPTIGKNDFLSVNSKMSPRLAMHKNPDFTPLFQDPNFQRSENNQTASYSPRDSLSDMKENSLVIFCNNRSQKLELDEYLRNGMKVYNTDCNADILEKVFEELNLSNIYTSNKGDEKFKSIITWEWFQKFWEPYPHECQDFLENAYKNKEKRVILPVKPAILNILWKESSTNNNLAIDFDSMRQINSITGGTNKIRRDIKIIYMEGWMIRESRKLKVWKQIYLQLTSEDLQYFPDDSRSIIKSDAIPLSLINEVKYHGTYAGKNNVFSIRMYKKGDTTYWYSAPTDYLAKQWVYYIQISLKKFLMRKARVMITQPRAEDLSNTQAEEEGRYSLCFCSISTSAYKFPLDEASTVACEVFKKFLSDHPTAPIRIYLVDLTESETLRLFNLKKPSDRRFIVHCANLVNLKDSNISCWYIVNASNPKFNEGGSGTNVAIHDACRGTYTPTLQTLTRRIYGDLAELSKAFLVPLPEGCPLRESQNVRFVIHVVGPNMNPKKPNYLGEDGLAKGKEELRKCYENVLQCFWESTGLTDEEV